MLMCSKCLRKYGQNKMVNFTNSKIGYCVNCKKYGFQIQLSQTQAGKFFIAKAREKRAIEQKRIKHFFEMNKNV